MDWTKKKILKDLANLYNFEMAQHKQQTKQNLAQDEEELYNTLTYYNLSVLLRDAINTYGQHMDHEDPDKVFSSINFLLFQIAGDIIKEVDKIDKKKANKLLKDSLELLKTVREE
jgi:hypothetical protein